MPSSPNYVRDYKRENYTAKLRGERGGSNSANAKGARARRKVEKKLGHKIPKGMDVDHKKPIKQGGGNGDSNLRLISSSKNRSMGGKSGSSSGKAAGARKGHKARMRKKK